MCHLNGANDKFHASGGMINTQAGVPDTITKFEDVSKNMLQFLPGVDKFTTGWDFDVGKGLESDEGLDSISSLGSALLESMYARLQAVGIIGEIMPFYGV